MSFEEASKRRDFTINAILEDPLSGEIIDLYGGREDIDKKILRAVSAGTFSEDSLRVLRAAQFAARFEFDIEPVTVEICRKIDVTDLPRSASGANSRRSCCLPKNPRSAWIGFIN